MNRIRIPQLSLIAAIVCSLTVSSARAQDGEALFKQTCGACHSIGKGRLVGPDLKDVNTRRKEDWIIKFVKGSQALIKSGDAEAKAIFDEYNMVMPDQNLKDEEIKSVVAYIAKQSGAVPEATASTTEAVKPVEKSVAGPELVAKGRAYFEGSNAFKNGGASCISCHNVNYKDMLRGGLLAKDLTNSYSRLGGDAGLSGILTAPPFPAMTMAFKNNPLTPDEVAALSAFLADADKTAAAVISGPDPLFIGGLVVFFTILVAIAVIWNKRKRAMVKEDIYKRQIESIN